MCDFRQLLNVHQHSQDSLDGAATIDQLCKRTAELGATHLTLTEHGNVNSAMKLYTEAPKHGLKPIIGIELYLAHPFVDQIRQAYLNAWRSRDPRFKSRLKDPWAKLNEEKVLNEIEKKATEFYFHLTVHFKDYDAYQHMCRLTPKMNERAIVHFGESKPVATLEDLAPLKGKITVGSSCMVGMIGKTLMGSRDGILAPNPALAEEYYLMLRELSGKDDFFIEIFPHTITHDWVRPVYEPDGVTRKAGTGIFKPNECSGMYPDGDMQKYINNFMVSMGNKYGDKILVSLDSHYATKSQKVIQDLRLSNGDEAWKFYNDYSIVTSQEAFETLNKQIGVDEKTFTQWVENSYEWGSKFNDFKMPTNKDRWLLEIADPTWMQDLKAKIDVYGRMQWDNPAMVERLKKEIDVLTNNGINLMPYFFVVEDVANFCRNNDILINLRGSGGGSLLVYLLGVSAINPLKHNLSFERFMTPGRIISKSMPDLDIDISDQDAVFKYLEQKYGDKFARISTDQLLRLKSAIKDAERYIHGEVRKPTEILTKSLPMTPQGVNDYEYVFGYEDEAGISHRGIFEQNEQLREYAKRNPDVWAIVKEALGIQRNRGVHACGTIIAPVPIQDVMPISVTNGTRVTGFSPKSVELAGGIKFDFLGLNTLKDIQSCLKSIKSELGITLDPFNLPDDKECWNMFSIGKTETVFQFDTPTVRPLLIDIKPTDLDGTAGVTALGRPGTLDSKGEDGRTLAEIFVARAKGEPMSYIHGDLEHILKETFGIQLYQEQTLQIFRDIGGLSYEEAEEVRRAISKKDEKVLLDCSLRLKQQCLKRGWTTAQSDLLMQQIMASSKYSFNKSHAISYSYTAYACMYLKTRYPLHWWKAILSNASKDELASKFWRYVCDFTDLPSVNNSSDEFQIIGDRLVAPFSIIKGLGEKTYDHIISNAPYKDFEHFVQSTQSKGANGRSPVTEEIVRKMIVSGLLDSLLPAEMTLVEKLDLFEDLLSKIKVRKKESVPEKYIGLGDLGRYMIKKQLIQIYSQDLRPTVLPNRGGKHYNKNGYSWWQWKWADESNTYYHGHSEQMVDIIDGSKFEIFKSQAEAGAFTKPRTIGMVAYVIDEKVKDYANKSKTRNELSLDAGGLFYQETLWPNYGEFKADSGYKGLICVVLYTAVEKKDKTGQFNGYGLRFRKIVPLITKAQLKTLDMV
jgi:DNA polymerase-3 subunit alpha